MEITEFLVKVEKIYKYWNVDNFETSYINIFIILSINKKIKYFLYLIKSQYVSSFK